MKIPKTKQGILRALNQRRALIEQHDAEAARARAEQRELWTAGREQAIDSSVLAEASGVKSTTVRQFWQPEKVAERASKRPSRAKLKTA